MKRARTNLKIGLSLKTQWLSIKPGSHVPPTYLRFSRRLQLTMFGDLFSGSPAHLRWIAGVLKLARNANRIGAIFNSFISNTNRIVLLECQFSLALVFVMRCGSLLSRSNISLQCISHYLPIISLYSLFFIPVAGFVIYGSVFPYFGH